MPTTLQTKFLEDSQGNKYAPVTTPNAVRWPNGDDLTDKLGELVPIVSVVAITVNTSSSCSITGGINDGKTQTIIYTNSTASDLTVTVPTTYQTPDGRAIELTCAAGGYSEVNYINVNGTIYARGL